MVALVCVNIPLVLIHFLRDALSVSFVVQICHRLHKAIRACEWLVWRSTLQMLVSKCQVLSIKLM